MYRTLWIGIILLGVLLLPACSSDEDKLIAPLTDLPRAIQIRDFDAVRTNILSGGDTVMVSATLVNRDGDPLDSLTVSFSCDAPSAVFLEDEEENSFTSDASGYVYGHYVSANVFGVNRLYISVGASIDSLDITVTPRASSLSISAEITNLMGDGAQQTQISVAVINTTEMGTIPVTSIPVQFSASAGYIGNIQVMTDSAGVAKTILTSPGTTTDMDSWVYCNLVGLQNLKDSLQVHYRGLTIDVTKELMVLEVDQDSTILTAQLFETSTGLPIPGRTVQWITSNGEITPTSLTNLGGVAQATLYSTGNGGPVYVQARIHTNISSSTFLYFGHIAAHHITLTADEPSILGDGNSITPITVTAVDAFNNSLASVGINLTSDFGMLSDAMGLTDSQGQFTTHLTSTATTVDIATYVRGSVVAYPQTRDSVNVQFRGVNIQVESEMPAILADGTSYTLLVAQVKEFTSNFPVSGAIIQWATTQGNIIAQTVTDYQGISITQLTSGFEPGLATITASINENISSQLQIEFVAPGPSQIEVDSTDDMLYGNGSNTTDLTIMVRDAIGNPADNAQVDLSIDVGILSESTVFTDSAGLAYVQYTVPATNTDLTAEIEITASNPGDEPFTYQYGIEIIGMTISILTFDISLIADGQTTTQVQALVYESTTHNPIQNEQVNWIAALGTVSSSTFTDVDGVAIAQIQSIPEQVGEGLITASVGNGELSASQIVLYYDLAHAISQVIVTPEFDSILGNGAILNEILVQVYNDQQDPASNILVELSADMDSFSINSSLTNVQGFTQIDFIAPAVVNDTTATITVGIRSGDAIILEEQVTIEITGLTLYILNSEFALLADGVDSRVVEALVYETTTHNPVVSETVYWATNLGTIIGSSQTDSYGVAIAALISVPGQTGEAILTAHIGSGVLQDALPVEFYTLENDLVDVEVSSFFDELRGTGSSSTPVYALVMDALGSPASNTPVEFSADMGTLSSTIAHTDSDGIATVTYTSPGTTSTTVATLYARITGGTNTIADTLSLDIRGTSITILDQDIILEADGESSAIIRALVYDTDTHNPLLNETVYWSSVLGTITEFTGTDEDGITGATMNSIPNQTGESIITAAIGDHQVFANATVSFFNTVDDIDQVNFSSEEDVLLGTGLTTSELTVTVFNPLNQPVAWFPIQFEAQFGTFSHINPVTNASGQVVIDYISPAVVEDVTDVITVTVESETETIVRTAEIDILGLTLSILDENLALEANGVSHVSVNALIYQTTSHNPLEFEFINWSTTLGTISSTTMTNSLGVASAFLQSIPGQAGIATVRASVGDGTLSADTAVDFFSSAEEVAQILVNSSGTILLGTGTDTVTISAQVIDSNDSPLENALMEFSADAGIVSDQSVLTDEYGIAEITFTAPSRTEDLAVILEISVSGAIGTLSESINFDVRGLTLQILDSNLSLIANGDSQAEISALLFETTTHNPVVFEPITWSSNLGTIIAQSLTQSNGIAVATIFSIPGQIGEATVVAAIGNGVINASTPVFFLEDATTLTTELSSSNLMGTGIDTAVLTTTLTNSSGEPISNALLEYSTDVGSLSSLTAITDEEGVAEILYTAPGSNTDITNSILIQYEDQTQLHTESVPISISGLTLAILDSDLTLIADGSSTLTIDAQVYTTTAHNPIMDIDIFWSIGMGVITEVSRTNGQGIAQAVIQSLPDQAGESEITAHIGDGTIEIIEPISFFNQSVGLANISVYSQSYILLGNGLANTTISAVVTNTSELPVVNTLVEFDSNIGTLSSASAITDEDGLAQILFTAPATIIDELTTITVSVIGITNTLTENLDINILGLTLELLESNLTLPADGESSASLEALLYTTSNHNPVMNEIVFWSSTLGTITGTSLTNEFGVAAAIIQSIPGQNGNAAVTAQIGNGSIQANISVEFYMDSEQVSIEADGSTTELIANGDASAIINANVLDGLGQPYVNALVEWDVNIGSLSAESTFTDDFGVATIIYTAPSSGTDLLAAIQMSINSNSGVITEIYNLDLLGISVTILDDGFTMVADGINTADIRALVFETTEHNPIVGEEVQWSTVLGAVDGNTVTDENGIATATVYSISGITGVTTITAEVGDGNISDNSSISFVDNLATVEITSSATELLANGHDQALIIVTAEDALGEPVENVLVTFESNVGILSNSQLLTESNGQAQLIFTAPSSTVNLTALVNANVQLNDDVLHETFIIDLKGLSLTILDTEIVLLADGLSNVEIRAQVIESVDHNPAPDELVYWITDLGVISNTSLTDAQGIGTAVFQSTTDLVGTATIVAYLDDGTVTDTVTAELVGQGISDISLSSSTSLVHADGFSTVSITAAVNDALDIGLSGVELLVTTDRGSFENGEQEIYLFTDSEGEITTDLTTEASTTDLLAHVWVYVVDSPGVTDNIQITFRGLTIIVIPEDDTLPADGESSTDITAQIYETSTGVPLSGVGLIWNTTRGIIEVSEETDITGTTETTLHSIDGIIGIATITARYGNTVTGTTTISFTVP